MSVNLVLLKSGEELITDVKEIKSGNEIVGYFFDDPLRLNFNPEQEPELGIQMLPPLGSSESEGFSLPEDSRLSRNIWQAQGSGRGTQVTPTFGSIVVKV